MAQHSFTKLFRSIKILNHSKPNINIKAVDNVYERTFSKNVQTSLAYRYTRFLHLRFTSSCQVRLKAIGKSCTEIACLLQKQCNAIVALRIRRSLQILQFYNKLGYGVNNIKSSFDKLKCSRKPIAALLGSMMFDWERNKITTKEIDGAIKEFELVSSPFHQGLLCHDIESWQRIIDQDQLKVWRRPMREDSTLYEYKVIGRYHDLPADAFFNAQVDIEYRRTWDKLIISLDVIDRDDKSLCEVLCWRMHFPYPMYAREYIYIRKQLINKDTGTMVVLSHSIDHPECPRTRDYVRVDTYISQMVIKAHSKLDENGFDYILTYADNPKGNFPSIAYNYMASTGVPDFVDKMIISAKNLNELNLKKCQNNTKSTTTKCNLNTHSDNRKHCNST